MPDEVGRQYCCDPIAAGLFGAMVVPVNGLKLGGIVMDGIVTGGIVMLVDWCCCCCCCCCCVWYIVPLGRGDGMGVPVAAPRLPCPIEPEIIVAGVGAGVVTVVGVGRGGGTGPLFVSAWFVWTIEILPPGAGTGTICFGIACGICNGETAELAAGACAARDCGSGCINVCIGGASGLCCCVVDCCGCGCGWPVGRCI